MSKQEDMDFDAWTVPRSGGSPCPNMANLNGTQKQPKRRGVKRSNIAHERRVRYLDLFYSLATNLQCKDNCKPSPFEGGDLMPPDRAMRLIEEIQKRIEGEGE